MNATQAAPTPASTADPAPRSNQRALVEELPARAELEPTRREWEEGRAGWKELVDSLPPEQARKAIFRHPVVGMLTLGQTLQFMDEHIKRHTGQVKRILRQVS